MIDPHYIGQVQLLLQLLPDVFKEKNLFLKGGTAINFFLRDIPRLSVDIDLVYGVVADRSTSINEIGSGMERISNSICSKFPGTQVQEKRVSGKIVTLYVKRGMAAVKLEVNTILRGSVFPGSAREISNTLATRLNIDLFVTANVMSSADLYGSKICAALDRQHPRDLFDIKILFENEGLTNDIRRAFVIYLASHDRPMAELLNPKRIDFQKVYENEFQGMTDLPVTHEELINIREKLISLISNDLTDQERQFLISIKSGEPQWELMGIDGIDQLPALQWKLANVKKIPREKHKSSLNKLREILQL